MTLQNIEKVKKYDQTLFEIELELNEMDSFTERLKQTQKKIKELSAYYFDGEWMDDFHKYKDEKGLHVLGEDYVYNAIIDFREKEIELLKLLCNNL